MLTLKFTVLTNICNVLHSIHLPPMETLVYQTAEDEIDVRERKRKVKYAAAQARYMAKKKLQQASNSSQTDNNPNSPTIPNDQETQSIVTPQETPTTKAKRIIIQIESATPNTSGLLSASGIEKQRQRAADKAIVLAAT